MQQVIIFFLSNFSVKSIKLTLFFPKHHLTHRLFFAHNFGSFFSRKPNYLPHLVASFYFERINEIFLWLDTSMLHFIVNKTLLFQSICLSVLMCLFIYLSVITKLPQSEKNVWTLLQKLFLYWIDYHKFLNNIFLCQMARLPKFGWSTKHLFLS